MPPVKYRRTTGSPLTVTRKAPDPALEAARHWERVDDKKSTSPAKAGDSKEA